MADCYQENCPWRIKGYSSPHSCQCAACPNRHDGTTCYASDHTEGYRLGKEDAEAEPLTVEQLRQMDGEPVWVKCLKPNKYINPPVRWRILEKSIIGTFGVWEGESCLSERDYGTDWLAYRRPPEGEA